LVAVEDLLEEHLAGIFPEETRSVEDGEDAPRIAVVVGPAGQESRALSETNARLHRSALRRPDASSGRWSGGATGVWRTCG